jgi:phasin family protein
MTTTAKPRTDSAAEKMQAVGKETMETVMRTSSEAASKGFEQAVDLTRGQVDAAVKGFDDAAAFSRGNLNAFIEAGSVCSKGLEDMKAEMVAITKGALEDSVKAAKAFSGARTAKDFMDLQSRLVQDEYEKMVATTTRLGELAMKLSQDVSAPLAARASAFADELSTSSKR